MQIRTLLFAFALSASLFTARGATIPIGPGDSVNWGAVNPGDTIQLAAGNYSGGFLVKKSGTSAAPITIKGPASGSAKWTGMWDVGASNFVVIDGVHANPYGIVIDRSGGNGGDGMRWGDQGNVTDLTVKFVELIGTPKTSGLSSGSYGMNFAPYDFQRKNLLVDHCRLYQWCETFRVNNWKDCTIQFSELRKMQTDNIDHADVVYNYPSDGVTFRWNSIWESPVDGIFFEYGGAKNWAFFGNIYWNSQNHLIFFKAPGTYGPLKIYNNVFYCPKSGNDYAYVSLNGSTLASGSKIQNNVFYNTTNDIGGDHNAYSPSTTNGYGWPRGEGNFEFNGNVFIDPAKGNFRLTSAGISAFKGKGYALEAPFDKDADANSFNPASWDIGAFVAGGTSPSPTVTPAPTATPAPTPAPAAKFEIGDTVSPTAGATVNVRATPSGTILGTHQSGDIGTILSGPVEEPLKQDVSWYDISWSASPTKGWSGDDDLVKTAAPSPTPSPAPSPTATPAPTATPPQSFEKWIEKQNDWIRENPPVAD